MRCVLLVGLAALFACSHGETVDRQKCLELRDHLIDVRLANAAGAEGVDLAQHRAAMKQALGEKFLSECEQHTTIAQLRCELKATDLDATRSCSDHASKY